MQPKAPQDERFWLLASLKLSGEATPEETEDLAGLLRDHPEWGLRMEQLTNIWRQKPADLNKETHFNRHLQRLSTHLSNPVLQYEQAPARPKLRRLTRWLIPTAAALIGAIVLIAIHKQNATPPGGYNTVTTRSGSRSKLQLPDGTLVWLNADSKLTYRIDDQNPTREVQLTGEAWFDVAKDQNRPFILHTQTIDIRVLGTMFNVQCYGNEKNTEASLFQGSVEVTVKNLPDKKIILRPSEKLTVHNNEVAVSDIKTKAGEPDDEPLMTLGKVHFQQKDSSYIESLWTKNQLAFDNRSLEEVAKQVERWYGVHITITDEKLKTARFSGVFEDETLAQVMDALKLIGDFHYTIHKKEVTITP
ncbi:MAG TPA: FecR domain-containing protein [Puia sp.]|nr:FecR domain-containing protein [Puia sp.]